MVIKIQFSDFWGGYDFCHWKYYFEEIGLKYEIVQKDSDVLIASCFGTSFLNKKSKKRIFWTGENWFRMDDKISRYDNNSVIELFDKVYSFDYLDNRKHYRFPLYLLDYMQYPEQKFEWLRKKSKDELYNDFKNKKFCTFFHRNGDSKFRNNFFHELNKIEKVDSYGSLFNNTGNKNISWSDKINISKNYKFSHCFENSSYDGYVTEKIMDAFRSDVIPIYWGGNKVNLDFNTKSFINVHEHGVDNSLELVKNMNQDFDLYWLYYNQPITFENKNSMDDKVKDFKNNLKQFFIDNDFL